MSMFSFFSCFVFSSVAFFIALFFCFSFVFANVKRQQRPHVGQTRTTGTMGRTGALMTSAAIGCARYLV